MNKGIFYCVGVGPGDPELMTFQAARIIRECPVAALPASGSGENAAGKIAGDLLRDKELLLCDMPMTRDVSALNAAHAEAARQVAEKLDQGFSVAFLTLGDPSIYATPMYLHHILKAQGYETRMVPGVPSFCAVAAALDVSLCERSERLQIIPASYPDAGEGLKEPGNKVLMKSGRSMGKVRAQIDRQQFDAMAVECCGMEGERIHHSLDTLEETASYFSVVVVKEKKG